jgi:hypothetical protein
MKPLRLLLLLWPLTLSAQLTPMPCQVQSSSDGHGVFTYTFSRGSAQYVWGIDTNSGQILMPSCGVLEIHEPADWTHSIDPSGMITWTLTNGAAFLDDPITFSVRSCLAESAICGDGWSSIPSYTQGRYAAGLILGVSYWLPGRTNVAGGGYQCFTFTGPALPALKIQQRDGEVLLSWSTLSEGCQLESADRISAATDWAVVTNVPEVVETNYVVCLSASNSARLFRLAVPIMRGSP